jgi:hypothetical protein
MCFNETHGEIRRAENFSDTSSIRNDTQQGEVFMKLLFNFS